MFRDTWSDGGIQQREKARDSANVSRDTEVMVELSRERAPAALRICSEILGVIAVVRRGRAPALQAVVRMRMVGCRR